MVVDTFVWQVLQSPRLEAAGKIDEIEIKRDGRWEPVPAKDAGGGVDSGNEQEMEAPIPFNKEVASVREETPVENNVQATSKGSAWWDNGRGKRLRTHEGGMRAAHIYTS